MKVLIKLSPSRIYLKGDKEVEAIQNYIYNKYSKLIITITKKRKTMQTNILDVLTENVQPSTIEYSFIIDKGQANNIIGHAKETLEDNRFMIKHVKITIMTAQIVLIRESFEDLSAIKKV